MWIQTYNWFLIVQQSYYLIKNQKLFGCLVTFRCGNGGSINTPCIWYGTPWDQKHKAELFHVE